MSNKATTSPEKELTKTFEAAGVIDYLQYLQSSKKILWANFQAGVARGFGITVGATLVLGISIWIVTKLVSLPFIGEYFERVETHIQEYADKTDYTDELEEMNQLLRQINDKLDE